MSELCPTCSFIHSLEPPSSRLSVILFSLTIISFVSIGDNAVRIHADAFHVRRADVRHASARIALFAIASVVLQSGTIAFEILKAFVRTCGAVEAWLLQGADVVRLCAYVHSVGGRGRRRHVETGNGARLGRQEQTLTVKSRILENT